MSIKIRIASHGELASQKNHLVSTDKITLQNPSDISLAITPEEVLELEKSGDDLIVRLIDGTQISIGAFFQFDDDSHLYFQGQDFEGQIWRAEIPDSPAEGLISWTTDARLTTDEDTEAVGLLATDDSTLLIGGLIGLGGITAVAFSSGSTGSRSDPDTPDAPAVDPTRGDIVTGTAEPDSTITLNVKGEVLGESEVDDNGNWTIDVELGLEHGDIIQAAVTDTDGNKSATAEEIVDRLGPTVTLDTLLTNDATPPLSGTVDDNQATVVVTVDGVEYTAINNGDGSWSLPNDAIAALPEGLVNVNVTATDPLSNIGSTQGQIEIDLSAPPAPEINPSNGTLVTGTAEPGTHVSLSINGDEAVTILVGNDGNWSWDPQPDLPDDTEIIAVATDDAGNISPPDVEIVDIEVAGNNPPNAPVISHAYDDRSPATGSLASGDSTDDATPTFIGSAESHSTVTILQNNVAIGTTTAMENGSWTFTPASIEDGNYDFTAIATNTSGNMSASSTLFNLTINTTIDVITPVNPTPGTTPIVAITEDANNDGVLNGAELSGTVDISVTLPAGALAGDTIQVSDGTTTTNLLLDATAITNGSVTTAFASPGEGNTITVTAVLIDQLGNTSLAGSDSATVDTTADNDGDTDTVTLDSITSDTGSNTNDFVTNDNTLTISGTVDLGDIGNDLSINFAGTDYTTADPELVVDGGGNWTLDLTAITLIDNTYTVTATVTDPVGNTASAVQNITIGQLATDDQSAAVSETDLPGPDVASGVFTFVDVDGDALAATLVEPTFALMSGGEAVTWAGDGTQLLVGSTLSNGEVIRITIDNTGNYAVTLSSPLDHPVGNAQDILAFYVSVDVTDGASTATGTLNISIEDDIPVVEDSQVQFSINAVPTTINGENLLGDAGTFGNDGGFIETVKVGGITYTYDAATDTVATAGASALVTSHTFNDANADPSSETIKGETLVVDMLSGDYSFTASGVPVIAPIANEAPEVGVYEQGGLLGIVGADLLGLVDLSQHQFFTATDSNNNIESVVVDYDPLLALDIGLLTGAGIRTWTYSSELAQEFGLDVQLDVSNTTILFINVTDYARLTITSLDGGPIDNLQLNEFLGSLALTGSALSLALLSSTNIEATDTNAASDAEDAHNLLNTELLGNTPPSVIQEGTAAGETLNGDAGHDRIYGYAGADTLNGLGGNDILRGGSGADTIDGGNGGDIVIGGAGNDTATGGAGTDVFLWEEGHAGTPGSPMVDEITDFDTAPLASGGDILNLGHLLQGEGRIGNLPGNLSNHLHFEFNSGNTIIHISTAGNYAGGFDGGQTDQQIQLTGVDLVTGLASDQDIIANLLASGKLLVDDATNSTNIVGGYTDVGFTAADSDGDTAGGSIRFDSSGAAPLLEGNSPPDVQVGATALLGLIGVEALNLIDLSNQDFNAADRDGNLQQVIIYYAPTLALDLGGLFASPELTASTAMAAELGLEFHVVNDPGLLGLVAPSSTLTITAIGGGTMDNLTVNELLGSVQFDQNISLLSNLLQADVLNATTITAVDSLGATSTDTAATLASANLIDSLNSNAAIQEGDGNDNNLNGSANNDQLYGYDGNDTLNGNDGNDLLRGGDGNDTLNGNDDNDLIFAGAGADAIDGGAGDDLLVIENTAFTAIDGGAGDDTLSLSGAGVVLDFVATLDPSDVDNIEEVDLDGSGANGIILDDVAVLGLTDGSNLLRLDGDVNDTADLRDATATGATPVFAGGQYNEYELGAATVWVNDAITVVDNG